MTEKELFQQKLKSFVDTLQAHVSDGNGQWLVKGFIDACKNIYSITSDTKVISKILEIHIFPEMAKFATSNDYKIVLAEKQNFYPDITLIKNTDAKVKFAIDFKTTYRKSKKKHLCNGFTLGSHGEYFKDRKSTKNIQYPYSAYAGHFCLGIIYDRAEIFGADETKTYALRHLRSIESVINNFQFFVSEKWKIASDKSGSGNTANIGSIANIQDIICENGVFSKLGENWFDDYWANYGEMCVPDGNGSYKKLTKLEDFVQLRNGDASLIVPKNNRE